MHCCLESEGKRRKGKFKTRAFGILASGCYLILFVEKISKHNPEMLRLGRDLYYSMRGATPEHALDLARVALAAALKKLDK